MHLLVNGILTVQLCGIVRTGDRQTVSGILMQFLGYQRSWCLFVYS